MSAFGLQKIEHKSFSESSPETSSFNLVSKDFKQKTVVKVNGVEIGNNSFTVIAGPCAVESEEQLMSIAHSVKKAGTEVLRGSAFKPRTSPYSFQGLGEKGLKLLRQAKEETGLVVETEVMDARTVKLAEKYVDILRVGSRNMQNFDLLKEVGRSSKPVILKNGFATTVEELLQSAEYIMSEGNENVILCERGFRSFEPSMRFALNLGNVAVLKEKTHLPVIVDPSHAAGKTSLVPPLSKAATAVGADGLIVEVHNDPKKALCDGKQALTIKQFEELMQVMQRISKAL